LEFSEQSLNELTEVFVRAKELALSQANDASASPQTRRIVAEEMRQLQNQVVQIANRKLGERFIFGGFRTTEAPFDQNGEYRGDAGEMKIHIDKEAFLSMNVPGSIVFQGRGLSRDGLNFKTLKQPQTVEELEKQKLEHPDRYKLVDDTEKEEFQFSGPETQKSQPMRGPASVRTTENVAPKSSELSANDEKENGINLFHALKKLELALSTDDKMGIQESLDRIDDATQQVVMARTTMGSRVMTIDNTLNSLHTNGVDTKSAISQLEDADAFQVISDINKTESALQATLQTSGKLIQKSLMDFIS
jgi:flagellar hook-associated protein 3 FlgL